MVSKPAMVGVLGGVAILTALGLNFWIVPGDEDTEEQRVEAPAVPQKPVVPDGTGKQNTASSSQGQEARDPSTAPSSQTSKSPVEPTKRRPSFDIVRVDPDGNAVIAGRAKPNAEVTIMDGDKEIGSVTSDERGEWVFLPDHQLGPGQFALTLRQDGEAETAESEEAVVLVVPEPGKDIAGRPTDEPSQPLAMVMPRDEASSAGARVLQAPAAGPVAEAGSGARATDSSKSAVADTGTAASAPSATGTPAQTAASGTSATSTGAAGRPATSAGAAGGSATKAGADTAVAAVTPDSAVPAAGTDRTAAPATGASSASASSASSGAAPDAAARDAGTVAAKPDTSAPAAAGGGAAAPAGQVASVPDSAAGATAPEPAATDDQAPTAPVIQAFPQPGSAPAASDQVPQAEVAASGDVSVDVIEYDDKGEVVFGGKTEPNADVEVYIDNKPAGSATADAEGRWQVSPKEPVAPGNYNLRVDKVEPSGKVKARVAFPFVRAAPLKGLPNDRLVVIQPGNNLWLIATRVYGEGTRYVQIHDANRDQIQDPDLIYPGQVFGLPKVN